MVWLNEHEVIPKTLMSVFDNVRRYRLFCLSSNSPFERNDEQGDRLFNNFSKDAQAAITDLMAREYSNLGDSAYLEELLIGYPIIHDWKPVAEYYIGLEMRKKFFLNEPK